MTKRGIEQSLDSEIKLCNYHNDTFLWYERKEHINRRDSALLAFGMRKKRQDKIGSSELSRSNTLHGFGRTA